MASETEKKLFADVNEEAEAINKERVPPRNKALGQTVGRGKGKCKQIPDSIEPQKPLRSTEILSVRHASLGATFAFASIFVWLGAGSVIAN